MKRLCASMLFCICLLVLLLCGCGKNEAELTELERLLARPASPYAAHVFSHQGTAKEETPESFAAYDLAILYGSRYLEQDLVVSSDGVLYCSHDTSPEALTGESRLFSEMTSAEIDALRVRDSDQRLLRLRDVFERYGGAVTYVIELKRDTVSLEPFLKLVEECQMQDHILVQSSSMSTLQRIEELWPEMPKLFLLFDKERYQQALKEPCVDIIGMSSAYFNQEECDRVHAAGKKCCVYVCNSTETIRRAIEIGADCYFTDYTGKALLLEELYRTEK